MRLRSLLFVPGDRPERMQKALSLGADALILDLEDSVALDRKEAARAAVATFLGQADRSCHLFVRINALDTPFAAADIATIATLRPDGLLLPKSESGGAVADLDRRLSALGNQDAVILPIATETPAAMFGLGTYGGASPRLCGLTWGAEDISAVLGSDARTPDGRYTPPLEMARSLALFGAHAAGVPAIETVYPAFRDLDGLAAYAARGRRDGFTGMMAIHPTQIAVINDAFTPSTEEIAHAARIRDLFAANPGAGALNLDGAMVDRPHLSRALRLLAAAEG